MSLTERLEKNKRDITRMKQEAYLRGRKDQEKEDIEEFIFDLKSLNNNFDLEYKIKKWQQVAKK